MAQEADATDIAAAHIASWQTAYRGLVPDSYLDDLEVERSAEIWRQTLTIPWGEVFVYEDAESETNAAPKGKSKTRAEDIAKEEADLESKAEATIARSETKIESETESISGRLRGFCHLVPSRDEDPETVSEVTALYLHPSYRRQQIGTQLFTTALQRAKSQGKKSLTLWVLRGNTRARQFYQSQGLEIDGATKNEQRPGFVLDEIRYRIDLWPVTHAADVG